MYKFFLGELIVKFNWLVQSILYCLSSCSHNLYNIKQRICAGKEVGGDERKLVTFDQTYDSERYWWWGTEGRRQRGPRKIYLLAVLLRLLLADIDFGPDPTHHLFLYGLRTQYSFYR